MTDMPVRPSQGEPVMISWPPRGRGAAFPRAPGPFSWLVRAYRRWRQREAAIAELARLDDNTLADIGLHRSEIRSAVIAADEPVGRSERRRCR